MANMPRIEFPGDVYHVMSSCNRAEDIFDTMTTSEMFYPAYGERGTSKKTGWLVQNERAERRHGFKRILRTMLESQD